jgi:hypothetical protein
MLSTKASRNNLRRYLRGDFDVKRICRYLPLFLLLFAIHCATAQSGFDVNIGFGAMHDGSFGQVDQTTLLPCGSVSSATCGPTKDLSGFAMGLGANLMLWKRFGIGGEAVFQPAKQDYFVFSAASPGVLGDKLQTRTTFYDFNGIFQAVNQKKVAVQLVGGIGGANVKFYENFTSNGTVLGNSSSTQFAGSANHFQIHAGAGVQIYVTDHIFVRPQFDVHYVPNLNQQFSSNVVPVGTIWLGYSFGDRP